MEKPELYVDKFGRKYWRISNIKKTRYLFHNLNGPAVESINNGIKQFWINGIYHTETEWKQKIRKLKLDRILK